MEKEGVTFTVSGVKDRVVIYLVALLLGGGAVANIIVPQRPDPYTGTQGVAQSLRTDGLEDRVEDIELEFAGCQRDRHARNESQAEAIALLTAGQKANNYLIKQCMRATGP